MEAGNIILVTCMLLDLSKLLGSLNIFHPLFVDSALVFWGVLPGVIPSFAVL